MIPPGKKLVAITAGALCLATLVATSLAFKNKILECYYVSRLESGSDVEESARRLVEMKSGRAVPALIKLFKADRDYRPSLLFLNARVPSSQLLPAPLAGEVYSNAWSNLLLELGESGVPVLATYLESSDPDARHIAFWILLRLGPGAHGAVPALIDALDSGRVDVRVFAAEVLGGIGPQAETAVPCLVKALTAPEPAMRETAARALRDIQRRRGREALSKILEKPERVR